MSSTSVYSLADLKNTSDDALPNFMSSLRFRQSHFLADVRLVLGYSAVAIAAAIFYYDYSFGWHESKSYTLLAVTLYFALNGALTLWIWFVEKGTVFKGTKDGNTILITSAVSKHYPLYKLTIIQGHKDTGRVSHKSIEASFTRWFTADGIFIAKPFQEWLTSEVKVIKSAADSLSKPR